MSLLTALSIAGAGLAWLGSRGGSAPGGSSRILGPSVAGSWYPAEASRLRADLDRYLEQAGGDGGDGDVVALIEPHAGFQYSGPVAAHGFREVRGRRFDRVVVVGPSHYVGFRGARVPDADAYRTPLGEAPLDLVALDALRDKPGFGTDNAAFRPEHSLEAEIPFLQRVLEPGFKLVPVLIGGGSSGPTATQIAEGIAPLLGAGALLVASSDFTHYGHDFGYVPFREEVPRRLRDLDMGVVRFIEARDVDGFERHLASTGATVCGRDAISVLLRLLPAGARCSLAAYDASGRMTGDWSHSVSYAAIVVRAGAARRAGAVGG